MLIVRMVCALSILCTLWIALRVFDDEKNKQLESHIQLSQQDAKLKELGELTSAVAHEIKTPLSSATMSCDLLEKQLPDNEATHRQLPEFGRVLSAPQRSATKYLTTLTISQYDVRWFRSKRLWNMLCLSINTA